MMRTTRMALVAALCGALAVAWAGSGRAHQQKGGAAEKVGERLDEAGRAIKRGAQNVAADVREGFDRTRESVHGMGVQSRVYGRLHWDKALTNADIQVNFKDGVVTLSGFVPDEAAKAKAVLLARDTVGVTDVADQTTIGAARTTTTTKEVRTDGTTTRETTKTTVKPAPRP